MTNPNWQQLWDEWLILFLAQVQLFQYLKVGIML